MKSKSLLIVLTFLTITWSCRNDDGDGSNPGTAVPPRTLSEVAAENDAEIRDFLETHTYNYEDFEEPIDPDFDFKINIQKLEGDNEGKTPLMAFIETQTITVTSEEVGRDSEEGEVVDHILYVLKVIEGQGEAPTVADRTITKYEGSLLDLSLFDGRNVPTDQYLPFFLRGYSLGLQQFRGGTGFVENENGTVTFSDFGVGLVFIPSGLAYFDSTPPNQAGSIKIPAYASLIFSFNLLDVEPNTDFDEDGIPSILEDLNGDGNLNNDNTDQEIEALSRVFFPNHNDTDDDQDGIPTIDEIELDADGNFVGFLDTDGDGIWDHLDNDN